MNDIVIKDLVKDYGKVRALNGVNLKVPSGSTFGLIGQNGAGKTTLFSILANFLKPTSGSINILGHDTAHYSKIYGKIGALPQDSLLYKNQSIFTQLVYFSKILGLTTAEAKEEVNRVLGLVNLMDKKHTKASNLSHGMTKRLGIAQALLGSPEIILLDEPLAGLDPPLVKSIRNLILSLKKDITLIISSHNLYEVEEICDHVAILHEGKIMASEEISKMKGQNNLVSYHLDLCPNIDRFKQINEVLQASINIESQVLSISYDETLVNLSQINNIVIDALREQNCGLMKITTGHSLEESFLKHIQK